VLTSSEAALALNLFDVATQPKCRETVIVNHLLARLSPVLSTFSLIFPPFGPSTPNRQPEHFPPRLVERLSIIYGFSLQLSFVCGLPAPTRPAARSRKVEVGLETFFIRSTHSTDEESIVF
jgi:hypothetical protein